MKILAISDTHCMHNDIIIPEGVDMIIHAGDISNSKTIYINEQECLNFLHWYHNLNIKYKILVAGNHDRSLEKGVFGLNKLSSTFTSIIYLENKLIEIEGLKIYGSPFTPTFNDWFFMRNLNSLNKMWENSPNDVDILITHGPPKYILDLSEDKFHNLEYCGDKTLFNYVHRCQPQHHIFGHIHNSKNCINTGTRALKGLRTQFHNVSCVTDGQFSKGLTSQGIIIEI